MSAIEDYKKYGKELEELLLLRYSPIALKLLEKEEDTPDGFIRPKRDMGEHLALCQSFGMVRRQRKCLAMLKDDHWCVWPLIGFGLVEFKEGTEYYDRAVTANFVEDPQKAKEFFKKHYPLLEQDKYAGFLLAPLDQVSFEPDIVLIYCRPAQLRSMLMAAKYKSGEIITSRFDAVDSCVHSTIPCIINGEYHITVPDPGEYERGLTDEDEMIFTVPSGKLKELTDGLNVLKNFGFGYKNLHMEMKTDFPRPQFYDDLFKMWGLEQGEIWKR